MSVFLPGDRALVVAKPDECRLDLQCYIGHTVTVVGTLDLLCGIFHTVRAEDGHLFAARPVALQKLPPLAPRQETASWEQCVWSPPLVELPS